MQIPGSAPAPSHICFLKPQQPVNARLGPEPVCLHVTPIGSSLGRTSTPPPRLRTGSRQEAGRAPGRLCPVAAQSLSLTGLLGPEEQVFRNCWDCVDEAPPRPYHGLLHPLRDQPVVCDAALSKHDPTRNWVGPGSGKQTRFRNRYHRRPPNTAAEPPHPRDAPRLSLGSLHTVPIGALASSCSQNRLEY